MLYKMRYRLVSHEDAKLQPVGHSYSTRSMQRALSHTADSHKGIEDIIIPFTQGQLQNGTNSQENTIVHFTGCF